MELPSNAALLIIDVQVGTNRPELGERNNPQAEDNIARLLGAWRDAGRPIIHVKHNAPSVDSPFHISKPGNAIMDCALPLPDEALVEKSVNCAFVGTDLEDRLRSQGIQALVLTGFSTNHCVESTARMASDLQFSPYVVSDATATHGRVGPDGQRFDAETVHAVSLASINEEFVTVVDTEGLLAALEAPVRT